MGDQDNKKNDLNEKVKQVKESLGKTNTLAALTYIPLLGWLLPRIIRNKEALVSFHAKQSMLVNFAIVLIYLIVFILENFPITGIFFGTGAILNPITGTLWIISFTAFIGVSIWAGKYAYQSEEWKIPYLNYFAQILNRIIKLD